MPGIVVALSGYGKTALQTLYVGIKLVKVKYIRLVVVYMYPLLKGQVGMVPVIAVQADYCRGAGKGVLYFLRKGALAAAAGAAYADDYHALDIPPIALFYHYNPERGILIDAKSKITLKMQKDTLPCGFTICLILRYNICAIIFQTVFYILDIRETLADEKKPRLIKHKDHTAKCIQAAGAFPAALRQARRHRRGHRAARAGRKAPG